MLVRMWKNLKLHTLLVGMENDVAALFMHIHTHARNENICPNKNLHMNFFYNSQRMKITLMPID